MEARALGKERKLCSIHAILSSKSLLTIATCFLCFWTASLPRFLFAPIHPRRSLSRFFTARACSTITHFVTLIARPLRKKNMIENQSSCNIQPPRLLHAFRSRRPTSGEDRTEAIDTRLFRQVSCWTSDSKVGDLGFL